ncbi:MAG: PD40 domain-containing protein [Burkholderiales bacterium]|nr:PD40 domain-containing protein [Burkholderiales bacterium]
MQPLSFVAVVVLSACSAAAMAASPLPEIVAPGVISGPSNDADASVTPDGAALVFARDGAILVAERSPAGWSTPRIAPFSGRWMDAQPTLAPDGSALVFVSNRPLAEGDAKHPAGNLWRVERHGAAWGEPVHLPAAVNRGPSIWGPSVAADGSVWFMDRVAGKGPFKLWRAQRRDGAWAEPVLQALGDPAMQQVDPAVAPDESFIVFSAKHPDTDEHERVYIAWRDGAGWGPAIDLGEPVNLPGSDSNESRLAPDGRTLYFTSDRQTPAHWPRSSAQAEADLARSAAWDNGNQNVWRVSLAPWLDAGRRR